MGERRMASARERVRCPGACERVRYPGALAACAVKVRVGSVRARTRTDLVEHKNELALHVVDDPLVEGWREVDEREADVDDQEHNVGHFGDAPQLTPHLEVVLKEAEPLDGVLGVDVAQPRAKHGRLVPLDRRLGLPVGPLRPLGDVDDRLGAVKVLQVRLKRLLPEERQRKRKRLGREG